MKNEKSLDVLVAFAILSILINSPPTPALAAAAEDPYKVVNEFCATLGNQTDRAFCQEALESDPRCISAKNNTDLLFISVDLSLSRIDTAKEYAEGYLSRRDPEPPLKVALKECIAQYNLGILELTLILGDLKADPHVGSYDALRALDALGSCQDSLDKIKVPDPSIPERNENATKYVQLCVAIAQTFH